MGTADTPVSGLLSPIPQPLYLSSGARQRLLPECRGETSAIGDSSARAQCSGIAPLPRVLPLAECLQAQEIKNALDYFSVHSSCFALSDLIDQIDTGVDRAELRRAIFGDRRFLWLGSDSCQEDFFVPESTLFRWFVDLSIRLARARSARLSANRLLLATSSLRSAGRWDALPEKAISFGQRLGFIGPAWTTGNYVFPIACILSHMSPVSLRSAQFLLQDFADPERRTAALNQPLEESVEDGLSTLREKEAKVIRAREGLLPEGKMTLEQVGLRLGGLSRERIRQLEEGAWNRLLHHSRKSIFVRSLILDTMRRQGRLTYTSDSADAPLRSLVAKCAGVPCAELPRVGIMALGVSPKEFAEADLLGAPFDLIDKGKVALQLDSHANVYLSANDISEVADRVTRFGLSKLKKTERVYLALRRIGRPAHYSKVASICTSMFPSDTNSERNIHAILGREKHGVVWIGVRGMFGLKEWGCERPAQSLFDSVTEIVTSRYKETGKCVPLDVISAELGKYRMVVNPTSLILAAHCNSALKRVFKNCFVPRETSDQSEDDLSADEWDRILRDFEKERLKNQDSQ